MFKDIKKLRELHKLQKKSEKEMMAEGFTPEKLQKAINKQIYKVIKDINKFGWIIVFLVIALSRLGVSTEVSIFTSLGVSALFYLLIHKTKIRRYF